MMPYLLLAFFALMSSSALRAILRTHRRLKRSVRGTGRLQGFVEERDSDGDKVLFALVGFEVDGARYTIRASGLRDRTIGEEIPVVYLPDDPSQSSLVPDFWAYGNDFVMLAVGVTVVLGCLGTIFSDRILRLQFPALF